MINFSRSSKRFNFKGYTFFLINFEVQVFVETSQHFFSFLRLLIYFQLSIAYVLCFRQLISMMSLRGSANGDFFFALLNFTFKLFQLIVWYRFLSPIGL